MIALEGIDNPFIALVASSQFVCVGAWDFWGASYWIDTLVLKTEGNTYATLLHHPLLFGEIQRSAQEVARRISGAVAGEAHASKSTIPSTHRNPYLSHYIICHLPLVFLSPTSPLPFYSPSPFRSPSYRSLLVCSCVGLLACHDGSR